jgi:post-segregation antitoxin (ccd killing protein)
MKTNDHLTHDLLVRALDDELMPEQAAAIEAHLSACKTCREQYEILRTLSIRLSTLVSAADAKLNDHARTSLWQELEVREQQPIPRTPERIIRRLEWSLAIAASLAVAAFLVPLSHQHKPKPVGHSVIAETNGTIEVDGETFIMLPYSNPELPLNAPHIVQMEVPVASLADAGVTLEPISNEMANADDSVLADVLIGLDGQPLGIHILSAQ